MSEVDLWFPFHSITILLSLCVLIAFRSHLIEATLLDIHVIAKSTIKKNISQKVAILFNLERAKLIISNSSHLMKNLFQFYEGQECCNPYSGIARLLRCNINIIYTEDQLMYNYVQSG